MTHQKFRLDPVRLQQALTEAGYELHRPGKIQLDLALRFGEMFSVAAVRGWIHGEFTPRRRSTIAALAQMTRKSMKFLSGDPVIVSENEVVP